LCRPLWFGFSLVLWVLLAIVKFVVFSMAGILNIFVYK
jgi:hypothetical protein